MMPNAWRLRPVVPGDDDFLLQVYASTRAAELALTAWSAADCDAFVRMQFNAQRTHYRQHWPASEHSVIEVVDAGAPAQAVGRVWLDWRADCLHLLDITLLPAWCGRGLGTAVLRSLQQQAAQRGCALSIQVEQGNPARRLYERLGFEACGAQQGFHQLMRWQPAGPFVATSTLQEICSEQA